MEGAKASSSRVQLIFVVLFVGAFVGANCSLTLVNFSQQSLKFLDVTTPTQVTLPPDTTVKFTIYPLPQGQITPIPETLTVFTFSTAPNATQNVTGVREPLPFFVAYVYDNATITVTESTTTNKMGFSINYSS